MDPTAHLGVIADHDHGVPIFKIMATFIRTVQDSSNQQMRSLFITPVARIKTLLKAEGNPKWVCYR